MRRFTVLALAGALICVCYHSVAIYSYGPAYGDSQYGFPFVYGYDQDDVRGEFLFRLAGFKSSSFVLDLFIGGIIGSAIAIIFIKFGDKTIQLKWIVVFALLLCFVLCLLLHPQTPKGVQIIRRQAAAIAIALNEYKKTFGSYPERKLWNALTGSNPKGIRYIIESRKGNSDPWGTPYEISISDKYIWFHSAGADRKFTEGSLAGSDDFIYSYPIEQDAADKH